MITSSSPKAFKQATSALTLANAAELAGNIIKEIAGNDIASSLNGSAITKSIIHSLVLQRIGCKLEEKLRHQS